VFCTAPRRVPRPVIYDHDAAIPCVEPRPASAETVVRHTVAGVTSVLPVRHRPLGTNNGTAARVGRRPLGAAISSGL